MTQLSETKKFYSTSQAAEYLGIPKSMIHQLTNSKRIAFYRIGKKKIFFKQPDLEAFLSKSRIENQVA
jgi:excisionase family DNA binding protein